MTVEVFVLSREKGIDDPFWDRLDRHQDAPLDRVFGQQTTIPCVNAGHDRRLIMSELLVVRQFAVELRDRDADDNATGDCKEDRIAQKEPAEGDHDQMAPSRISSTACDASTAARRSAADFSSSPSGLRFVIAPHRRPTTLFLNDWSGG